ncbi:BMP family ABC transporter substrate-binding protein [Pseudorhodoplanes sinuspersici]|uniref:BMP family ABC transporter substrate-binding protein n=1 Tax=Pseudorhodoplanes sinuspersici TaxID=1235591 RepID=A0A1W6ZZ10_9HYPH|nr:BMP family ABC transporter substrate-binding protein [Pseudorhodoplanes sinuspersici]ARQ02622.1 BMP family ABC transporter substrate-binding protein [Pseudorhodoplanes sinuspersici]RKE74486.1 nucleoside-binding protein [Pseudorhodoplanes sinuspersici]
MKIKSWLGVIATVVVAIGSMTSAVFAEERGFTLKAKPRIAMIMFADKKDGGWTQAFEEARVRMEKALDLKIAYVENVPENAAAITPPVERFIKAGYNIIIGTAFGYSDTFLTLSKKYPDVAFLNASGTTNGPNLQSFYGRTYASQYLCGMVAGAMTKTGKLGFVGANPFGVVIWTVNGFEMGARLMKPDVTTTVIYTGAWNDPVKERAAAQALMDGGADIIGQHVDTPTPQIVAQERKGFGTGHHRDLSEFASKATVCSSIWFWDRYLTPEIKKIIAGNWKPNPHGAFPSVKDGPTDIAINKKLVPEDVVKKVMAERQALIDGKEIYAGPLKSADGKDVITDGKVLDDGSLWKMDWYVPGVIAQR